MIPCEILKKIRQIEIRTNRIVTETLAGVPGVNPLEFEGWELWRIRHN
jgi:hypothetical protein